MQVTTLTAGKDRQILIQKTEEYPILFSTDMVHNKAFFKMSDKPNIYDLLRLRYAAPEWAFLCEVSNGTGHTRTNSCDAIAMNMWHSRGLVVHGIEIKTHRSDWLRELKQPMKAEAFFKYCDYWWLVTESEGVANLSEIPPTWGWITIKIAKQSGNARLEVMKEAPKLDPEPLDRGFIAAVLRRAVEVIERKIYPHEIKEEIEKETERLRIAHDDYIKSSEHNYNQLKEIINSFEKTSGISMQKGYWGDRTEKAIEIGEAVKLVLNGGLKDYEAKLIRLQADASKLHSAISLTVENYKKINGFSDANSSM